MDYKTLIEKIETLPDEGKDKLLSFVEYLKEFYDIEPEKPKEKKPLSSYEFVGMWKDREDMKDSVAWVKKLRREQWNRFEK